MQINSNNSRRKFITSLSASLAASSLLSNADHHKKKQLFEISIAEWSLHKSLFGKKISNLDFPVVAKKEFKISAVEYVNQFFKDKATDKNYLNELKKICDNEGVKSLLIMCDGEGKLGDPDKNKRISSVNNHKRWIEAAKHLGCHSIRVNASSSGSYDDQQKLAADGLSRLSEFASTHGLNVIVENHGGLSSNGQWLSGVMKSVNMKNCGTLPDFGNFRIGGGKTYDRYKGVKELMPFAKAVSAKSHDFDDNGNEIHTDYHKMMKIVIDAGYRGYVGVEYEGSKLSEYDGIKATKKLLESVREKLS
ncbi:MAG: xylose isomerase [Verrucomicrobiales bacterium]|jgi:sugar phosphate isomerase/epimerase|nr:xylose isomerase [Verrucomicrobiales bacterium]MAN83549.1 xylose isomerase [Verrucomicrobiales bacterium]|tara:strand:- start:1823 stop:2740 length:918 start_codon:yes stop_codon:yes gene_type:complete